MSGQLAGKVAIVTGAGSIAPGIGNGKATAVLFAREGAHVVLVDLRSDAALATREMILQEGRDCFAMQADVSCIEDCNRVVGECIRQFGRLDILHNNVGIEIAGGLESATPEIWAKTLQVNLTSMFFMCKQAIVPMKAQKHGVITNISSINATRTAPTISLPYSVSKAGVLALTREIAVEYAACGVRANSILPGMMSTPFVTAYLTQAYGGDVEEMMRIRDRHCPTGRQGTGWDVANLAVFLASDAAAYITGAEFIVDGGQSCRF